MSSRNQKITPYRNLDVQITGSIPSALPTKIGWLYVYNNAATVRYLKLYNKATAATAADTPIYTLPIPATSGATFCADGKELPFSTGLSIRACTGVADADNTAPTANDVIVNINLTEYLDYTH